MKKWMLVCMLFITAFLLTGCGTKYDAHLIVDEYGLARMEVISAKDNERIDFNISQSSGDIDDVEYTDDDRWDYLIQYNDNHQFKDFIAIYYEEGDYKGYQYIKDLGALEDIVGETPKEKIQAKELFYLEKFFEKKDDVYSFQVSLIDDSGDLADVKKYNNMEGIEVLATFRMTLPYKAISHNATEVSEDGLTYTWDLTKVSDLQLSFRKPKEKQQTDRTSILTTKSGIRLLPVIIFLAGAIMLVAVVHHKNNQ